MTGKIYMEKMKALGVIGPGHELVIDAPVRQGPSDGILKAGDIIVEVGNVCKDAVCANPSSGPRSQAWTRTRPSS